MVQCAIAECKSNQRDCVKNKSLSFHKFPQNNKSLSKIWVLKCKRLDSVNVNNARVCSLHFSPQDFILDFRKELMGWNVPNKLKPDAFPNVNLPATSILKKNSRTERALKRKNKDLVNSLITNPPKKRSILESYPTQPETGDQSLNQPDATCEYYRNTIIYIKPEKVMIFISINPADLFD
jgi:THAP domain